MLISKDEEDEGLVPRDESTTGFFDVISFSLLLLLLSLGVHLAPLLISRVRLNVVAEGTYEKPIEMPD